ncbi:MAG: hypothetical protein GY708_28795 [Actinomycetia bacterium]|nr:hypothetical protein [Actinomycetes bacterium]MCP4958678.1 hypothetical protein [Actinomycetes bacterium]
MILERIGDGPIIGPDLDQSIGDNIQGPSLIRVPEWVDGPLGRYYLYFADHKGRYIRLAYADDPAGPYTVHASGCLDLDNSCFPTEDFEIDDEQLGAITRLYVEALGPGAQRLDIASDVTAAHIASPDVHIDDHNRRIVMYFHGLESVATQISRCAVSTDGLDFTALSETVPNTYLRVFRHKMQSYGVAMPGIIYRLASSPTAPFPGLAGAQRVGSTFEPNMRHCAVKVVGDTLYVLWTRVGDTPESILLSTIDLTGPPAEWNATDGVVVLEPEHPYEGADRPIVASVRSVAHGRVNELRDPCWFVDPDSGDEFVLYAVAGESGIAIARITG